MRKLESRCSPPVRMTRSGSGRPPVYRAPAIVASSIASAGWPDADDRRTASTSSVRPA